MHGKRGKNAHGRTPRSTEAPLEARGWASRRKPRCTSPASPCRPSPGATLYLGGHMQALPLRPT
eukprot:7332109-Pyramimonas_sp.AAC.1